MNTFRIIFAVVNGALALDSYFAGNYGIAALCAFASILNIVTIGVFE